VAINAPSIGVFSKKVDIGECPLDAREGRLGVRGWGRECVCVGGGGLGGTQHRSLRQEQSTPVSHDPDSPAASRLLFATLHTPTSLQVPRQCAFQGSALHIVLRATPPCILTCMAIDRHTSKASLKEEGVVCPPPP
jgi:hypothetical protein